MYRCNNCKGPVPEPQGRCPSCNMRLHTGNVSEYYAQNEVVERYADDLSVSHRCGNCAGVLINEGGRCKSCHFPIPAQQLLIAPEAEIIPLKSHQLPPLRRAN